MSTVSLSPRRRMTLIWVFVVATLCLFLVFYHDAAWTAARRWKVPFVTDSGIVAFDGNGNKETVRVAIIESGGTHDEVTAALVTAFGGLPNIELTMLQKQQRYNMEKIMGDFDLKSPIAKKMSHNDLHTIIENNSLPHVIMSTTCELDLDFKASEFRDLLAKGETYLFCLIHHADRWREGKHVNVVREYLEKDMAFFMALSQHTADFLRADTQEKWEQDFNYTTEIFPPVFPVQVPEPDPDGLNLAMQGDYSSNRRDYAQTFEQLGNVIGELRAKGASDQEKNKKVTLHVIGHGKKPSVPDNLKENVVFDESLSYPDFYGTLATAFSIIPAFANDEYYDRKASSTVPASLIAGAPIVASQQLLDAYSYLPADTVWLSEPGEDEMDAIKRYVGDMAGYQERTAKVKATTERLIQENIKNVGEWVEFAVKKVNSIKDAKAKEEQEKAAADKPAEGEGEPAPQ